MTAKSNTFRNDWLKLIFNSVPISGLADNAAGGNTVLYAALHTADPGAAGTQNTSEVAYEGYARVAISRTTAGWTVTGNSVSPAAPVEFGEMLSGTAGTATHMTVGTAATGSGKVLYRGALTPTIPFSTGVIPRLRTTTTITEE